MSFNWSEYLGLAQQLAGKAKISATQESRLRSARSFSSLLRRLYQITTKNKQQTTKNQELRRDDECGPR